jgi:aryl-alcohol dehydrogenase-like predicted oxidoreductase
MQKHTVLLDSSTMLVLAERWVSHSEIGDELMCERIFAAVKDSCERLQTDYVDVFQVCSDT